MEIDIGMGKKARQAYGFDDIAIVPSRRTRDPQDVDIGWKLGPHLLELPLLGSAMDGVVSPETAIKLGELGGLGVLNLEGIFSRYEDADIQLTKIAKAPKEKATAMMQKIYEQPVEPRLIARRIEEIKSRGVLAAGSLTPQRVRDHYEIALAAGLDVLVIQGTVVSAEHVSSNGEVLNLKEFIASLPIPVIVGGCASYQTALHLMRTGAAAVLVGVGPGAACTTRGARVATEQVATLEEIVIGPATENDGTLNLMGALRTAMATCGYESIHDFQKAEIMLAPAIKTEGKSLQQAQQIG